MKNPISKSIGFATFAFIALCVAQISVIAQEKNEPEFSTARWSDNQIVGVWNTSVTPLNCQTGEALAPPFAGLITYNKGGTLAEYGANPATPFRTPGHGIWEKNQGSRQYSFAFSFIPLTPSGMVVGRLRVEQTAKLSRSGDEMVSRGTFVLRNLNGDVIGTGCTSSTASRFE
ncbi:MAG: hypothetical protein ABI539_00110 [Acidobacteriota bacterium]